MGAPEQYPVPPYEVGRLGGVWGLWIPPLCPAKPLLNFYLDFSLSRFWEAVGAVIEVRISDLRMDQAFAKSMHELFATDLENYQIKEDLNEAILIELESTYYELNKDNVEREKELKNRMAELKRNIEKLEEKHFIKE